MSLVPLAAAKTYHILPNQEPRKLVLWRRFLRRCVAEVRKSKSAHGWDKDNDFPRDTARTSRRDEDSLEAVLDS